MIAQPGLLGFKEKQASVQGQTDYSTIKSKQTIKRS